MDKKGRRRKAAIDELLSTEKTYVNLMSKLVEHFVLFLRSNTSILSADDYKVLFPTDIHSILGLNQTFLDDLTKVIESDTFNNENTKIGDILYTFCPHFKMYQNYCNNYSAAATRLAKLRKKSSSSFSIYCDKQMKATYFHLPLESLIILPIQRMPRYKMLLEEIIKHTDSNHPDLKQLSNALTKISEVNHSINNRMKEFDSRIKVQNIENRFGGKITNLVTPSRRYIKEGQLCKIENKDDQDYLFILFSDCILYATQSMIGDKLIFGELLNFNSKFKIKQTSKTINVHNIENLFEIHSTKESFMVYAATKQEMDEWFNIIDKTYKDYMSLSTVKNQEPNDNIYAATLVIPNDFADKCMVNGCSTKFSFVNRRHHCKYCGFVICSPCSNNKLPLRRTENNVNGHDVVRVCDVCYKTNVSKVAHINNNNDNHKVLVPPPPPPAVTQKKSKPTPTPNKATPNKSTPKPKPKSISKAKPKTTVDIDRKLIALETDKKKLQRQVSQLESTNNNLKRKVSRLEQEITDNKYKEKQIVDKLKKQNDELLKDNQRLQSLVDALSSTTDENKKAEEIQNTKIKTLEAHNQNLQNELKQKEDEIKDLLKKQTEILQQKEKQKELEINELLKKQTELLQEKENDHIDTDNHDVIVDNKDNNSNNDDDDDDDNVIIDNKDNNDDDIEDAKQSEAEQLEESKEAEKELSASPLPKPVKPPSDTLSLSNTKGANDNDDDDTKQEPNDNQKSPQLTSQLPSPTTSISTQSYSNINNDNNDNDNDNIDEPTRICSTCNKKIVGRALRTKGGIHHRKCHVCSECKVSLAGKRYGILGTNGTKKKLCEQCTNKANERRREQWNQQRNQQKNTQNRTRTKTTGSSSLVAQMNKFRNNRTKVPKPWEAGKPKKTVSNTLKPSVAASMTTNNKPINKPNNKPITRTIHSQSVYKQKPKKKGTRSTSLMSQKKCGKCKMAIFGRNAVEGPNNTMFHPNCFQCGDCHNELQPKHWREYPIHNKGGKKTKTLTLCPICAKKRDETLFSQHQGKLKLNI